MYVITYIYQLYHHIITRIMAISRYHQFFRLISPYHLIFRRISCITRKSDITISPEVFGEYHHITPKKVQYHHITIPWGGPIRTVFLAPNNLLYLRINLHVCQKKIMMFCRRSINKTSHPGRFSNVSKTWINVTDRHLF